jgi:glutathione S-transferase/RNA polymerase-associated protein
MAVTLFEHPLSPYARKLKIVLYEKGIDFTRQFVSPAAEPNDPVMQAWVASSPRLEVPTLVDGDLRVFDSTVILEYVEERWPEPPSLPSTPAERARVRMLEELCDGELEAVNWGLMELNFFKRAEGAKAAEMTARAASQLRRIWTRLERELDGRQWMNGERFGRGDAAVYPHIVGSAFFGQELPAEFARLRDWAGRAAERPSVQRDTTDVSTWMQTGLTGGASTMPRVRQYRDYRLEWMMKSGGVDIVLEGIRAGTIMFAHEGE